MRFVEKVDCGAALESKVVEEPKVDSELPDLRRSWRSRRWKAGRLTSELFADGLGGAEGEEVEAVALPRLRQGGLSFE